MALKLDVTSLSYDAAWYDFETGLPVKEPSEDKPYLQIRPYPLSRSNAVFSEKGIVLRGEDQCEVFKYCLVGWKNVVDANGKPLKLTDDVKQKIYDFNLQGIASFVGRIARIVEVRKEQEEKNS